MSLQYKDYTFICSRIMHIASQLREEIKIRYEFSLCGSQEQSIMIDVYNLNVNHCKSFWIGNKAPETLIFEVFEYCIDNDLFRIPLTIKIK